MKTRSLELDGVFIWKERIIPHLMNSFAKASISSAPLTSWPCTFIDHQRSLSLTRDGRGGADGGCWCQAADGDTDDPQLRLEVAGGGDALGWGKGGG